MNKVFFSLVIIVTIMALTVSCTSDDEESTSSPNSDLSSCGQTVLSKTSYAYRTCFSGDSSYGACETCGFYNDESSAQGNYDCITCPDNYGIDVYFDDCTGYCVKKGTETNPISSNSCTAPIACVKE